MPRCWSPRPARARPRACRWRCSIRHGLRTGNHRAGAAPDRSARERRTHGDNLGERVGETVGYRVRFGSKVSRSTRIEVVTEGIFSRKILDDPELSDVAAVLFDEFHERSLDADLGLALARDAQTGLREDLRLLVMSATLDGARVAELLGEAPVIASEGRAFPVETRYLGRKPDTPLERQMADAIATALRADPGSVLAFLPGAAEIRRTQNFLAERIHDAAIEIVPLFGALEASVQDRAIAPAPKGRRKVVLATSIAETSLTIEGVRIVVDSGLARVPRYEPDIGLTRLETVRASRAAVDQRRGRAGRTEPGVCYRLWDEPQTASLCRLHPARNPQRRSVVAGARPRAMGRQRSRRAGLSRPAATARAEGSPRACCANSGALDGDGRITAEGKSLRALALPPRLARMIVDSQPIRHGRGGRRNRRRAHRARTRRRQRRSRHRLDQFRRDRSQRAAARAARLGADAGRRRWLRLATSPPPLRGRGERSSLSGRGGGSTTAAASSGHPHPQPLPARGRGADCREKLPPASCSRLPFPTALRATAAMAVLCLPTAAAPRSTRLVAGARALSSRSPNSPAPRRRVEFCWRRRSPKPTSNCISPTRSKTADEISFDRGAMALRARRKRTLHAITLSEAPLALTPSAETARILADGLIASRARQVAMVEAGKTMARPRDLPAQGRRRGAAIPGPICPTTRWRRNARIGWMPALHDKTSLKDLSAGDLSDALMTLLPWELRARLDREAPTHFEAPTGTQLAIDYEAEQGPTIAVRLQELFGLNTHPVDREGQGAAGAGIVVAGASTRTGDARSAGFLARQLCGRALRSARTLSAASLAGRSGHRACRPAGSSPGELIARLDSSFPV